MKPTNTRSLIVRNAVASLDGKIFKSREDIEDAVFPLFGPLTVIFQGEGHRDLVDRLIAGKWILIENDGYHMNLPKLDGPVENPSPVESKKRTKKAKEQPTVDSLSFNECSLLMSFLIDGHPGQLGSMDKLIEAGLVEENQQAVIATSKQQLQASIKDLLACIKREDWYDAKTTAIDVVETLNLVEDMIVSPYQLTKRGEKFALKLETATVTLKPVTRE